MVRTVPKPVVPPSFGPVVWTPEEDDILRQAVYKHGGKKWKKIATFFQQKTQSQCSERWNELQNHGSTVKKPWCSSEDMRMIELVKTHGPSKWAVIASYLPGRNGKQCRERWHNQLNPAIKKGPWTNEEDEIIRDMQSKYGNRWAKITERLPGRTDNAVKNHWHSSMKAKLKRLSSASPGSEHGSSTSSINNDDILQVSLLEEEMYHPRMLPATPVICSCADVKLEPGSLSPDSVAMCPSQLEPSLRPDNSLFLLNDGLANDDDDDANIHGYFSLPQVLIDEVLCFAPVETDTSNDDTATATDDEVESLLDSIGHEELVLSTDVDVSPSDDDATPPMDVLEMLTDDVDNDIASLPLDQDDVSCLSDLEPSTIDDSVTSSSFVGDESVDAELWQVLSTLASAPLPRSLPTTSYTAIKLEPKPFTTPASTMCTTFGSILVDWGAPPLVPTAFPSPTDCSIDGSALAATARRGPRAPSAAYGVDDQLRASDLM